MITTKPLTPQNAAEEIRKAVYGLKAELQKKRELTLENFHRALIIALHTNSHWKKAKWR